MIANLIENINSFLWGYFMLPLIIGVGVFLTVKLNFIQIRAFGSMLRSTVGSLFSKTNRQDSKALTPWQTVSTALASTIGTGSLVGVAVAIQAGGPGVVFWMWVSAFLGMVIKYSEIALSVSYRKKNCNGNLGGPMFYLRYGLRSKLLAVAFSFFCLCVSFGMGNGIQAKVISSSLETAFRIKPFFTGILLAALVAVTVLGGVRRIARVNSFLVPFMSLIYVFCCIVILILRLELLPSVIRNIFKDAFQPSSAAYGVSAYGMLLAMKNGFAKGIFSNEAGLGSAPIAHGSSVDENAQDQGFWGMFEVFFTTIVICSLTAFVILTSKYPIYSTLNAADLTLLSFEEALPDFGGACVCFSGVLFSLSTILGWAFYGEIVLRFLFRKSKIVIFLYRVVYVSVAFVGAIGDLEVIWSFSEMMNALMAIPNLIGIIFLSNQIQHLSKKYKSI